MSFLLRLCLRVLHVLYLVVLYISAIFKLLFGRAPRPLTAPREKLPAHVAIILASDSGDQGGDVEDAFVESVRQAIAFCHTVGVPKLTVYDRHGVLVSCPRLEGSLPSRTLTVRIASKASGKPTIAAVSRILVLRERFKSSHPHGPVKADFTISVEELDAVLECYGGLPSPDLLIVHSISPLNRISGTLELYGFPPWQLRLTEIYKTKPISIWDWLSRRSGQLSVLHELHLRAALDEFALAEMRVGK